MVFSRADDKQECFASSRWSRLPNPPRFIGPAVDFLGGLMTAHNSIGGKAEFQDFPLSSGQARLWFLEHLVPGTAAYNVPEAWRLRGPLDHKALELAFQDLIARHETLRTRFLQVGGQPVQQVLRQVPFKLRIDRVPKLDATPLLEREAKRPFDLGSAPLIRGVVLQRDPFDHVLLVTLHHIIADDWSLGILFQELAVFYSEHAGKKLEALPPLPLQYADFSVWQRTEQHEAEIKKSLDYWVQHLKGCAPVSNMPFDRVRPQRLTGQGETLFHKVPPEVLSPFKDMCKAQKVTLFAGLLASFNALTHRYTQQEELVVGGVFAGRDQLELERLIGFFANTHAMRMRLSGEMAFKELLSRAHETAIAAGTHQAVPLDHVIREVCPDRTASMHPLFQMILALQPARPDDLGLPGIHSERIEVPNGGAKFDLALLATETAHGLSLRCEYDTDLYDSQTVRRILTHYENVLRSVASNAELTLGEIQILDADEERLVLAGWNEAESAATDACLHAMFEEQARTNPGACAVLDSQQSLTYAELELRAERVAGHLRQHGLGLEEPVGICLRRSADMLAVVLGVLKAGGCYVPLDPAYPVERLDYMLENSGCRFVVRNADCASAAPAGHAKVLTVEEMLASEPRTATTQPTPVRPDHLSHIIYTSGSTGRPKGVALEHRNAAALVRWAQRVYTREELSGVLAATSLCFDLSVFEIFVPLSSGGTVILAENAMALPSLAANGNTKVTLINTVPSAIRELLRLKAIPTTVRIVNLAGEPLTTELADRIYSETGVEKVYDLYGPTETTTYSTYALRRKGGPATIGRPLSGERAYVLDAALKPVPIGVPGELYVAGSGVARGYYRNPEATAARFIPDPFVGGERMYRTGDSVRWRADGTLVYLGRLDQQVKLRGYRIEPGELETVLRGHPAVRDAHVMVREDRSGDGRLVAYLAPKHKSVADEDLRQTLSARVPTFMLPSAFVWLPAIPLTPNGKVDRAALPAPENPPAKAHGAMPPSTPDEAELMVIWREVLGRNSFGVADNFFELGGHSLLATQVTSRVASAFNVELPLSAIFENPTIQSLSVAVRSAPRRIDGAPIPKRMRRAEADRLLKELEFLDDSQLESLLKKTGLTTFQ